MRIKNLDLVVAICFVVINIGWTQIPNRPLALGILFVLPLTFILPGYTLTEILFRGRSLYRSHISSDEHIQHSGLKQVQPVGAADQIVLSLGLSLGIDVLVGFGLNVLPVGLQASSWALALGLLTTIFTLLTAFLRQKDSARIARVPRFTINNGILLGLATVVIIASVWLAIIRPLNPQPSFTQLWMLPAKNNDCSVSIGAQSFETTPVTYSILMMINNTRTDNWSSILLYPQQKWSQSVAITPGTASSLYIQVQLYRTDKPDILYRSVHITFHVTTNTNTGQIQTQCKL